MKIDLIRISYLILKPYLFAWAWPGDTDRGRTLGLDRNLSGVSRWNLLAISAADLKPASWRVSAEWRRLRTPDERLKGTGWVTPTLAPAGATSSVFLE